MVSKVLTGLTVGAMVTLWPPAHAGSVMIPGLAGGMEIEVTSFQAQRFSTVMRQQYDFSCGSAALASLLTFHYDDPVSEADVFEGMFELADLEKVRREGFSMLDMKRYLEQRGYQADGFRMPLEGLRTKVRVPVIVLVNLEGYRHFVIIKGISESAVLVGDPARGLKEYSRSEFEQHWDGAAFLIRSHLAQGRASFMLAGNWSGIARAPISSAQDGPALGHTLPYWSSSREW